TGPPPPAAPPGPLKEIAATAPINRKRTSWARIRAPISARLAIYENKSVRGSTPLPLGCIALSAVRRDVLVGPEDVPGIVLLLHIGEASVAGAVVGFDAALVVVRHEVDVAAGIGEGCRRVRVPAHPLDGRRVLRRVRPHA